MSITGFKFGENIEKYDYESLDNRPFYYERKITVDPSKAQTIYDSENSDSSNIDYTLNNEIYSAFVLTDGTFQNYIINDSEVTITQKITVTTTNGKSSNTTYYYITRTGIVVYEGNIIHIGNLYLHTLDSNDDTGEDYALYYDSSTGQLTVYLSSSTLCDDGSAISSLPSFLSNVGLKITTTTIIENIYHKIDPKFLPDEVASTQPDYLQNDSTASDYIKNRPFYTQEVQAGVQTIYDSENSNSPKASYSTSSVPYVAVINTDRTLQNYITDNTTITIAQKFTAGAKETKTFSRDGQAIWHGDNIYCGNLYYHTLVDADKTEKDFLYYYETSSGQLYIYLSSNILLNEGNTLVAFRNYLNAVDITISVNVLEAGIVYYKIDSKFLPNNTVLPCRADKNDNVIFENDIYVDGEISVRDIKDNTDLIKLELSQAKTGIAQNKEKITKIESKFSENYIILTDIENGSNYALQMKNGSLITILVPSKVQVTTLPNKTTYRQGEYFDPTGMVVTVIYSDGTTKTINDYALSHNMETYFDTIGETEVIITAEIDIKYQISIIVNVVAFDPAVELVDFNYITNSDGTYTLTYWKQTLNGESSTELIVPDNALIKI